MYRNENYFFIKILFTDILIKALKKLYYLSSCKNRILKQKIYDFNR